MAMQHLKHKNTQKIIETYSRWVILANWNAGPTKVYRKIHQQSSTIRLLTFHQDREPALLDWLDSKWCLWAASRIA